MLTARRKWLLVGLIGVLSLWGCSPGLATNTTTADDQPAPSETPVTPAEQVDLTPTSSPVPPTEEASLGLTIIPTADKTTGNSHADVLSVNVSGDQGAYNFSVTLSSPDEGCNQYADWWEVVSQDGELLYRRILLHSHVNEQPFSRSGGPVPVDTEAIVLVRAHMHPSGYGGDVMRGSVANGFKPFETGADFAQDLAQQSPLPDGCDF